MNVTLYHTYQIHQCPAIQIYQKGYLCGNCETM
jgi:hypothetical protein